MVNERSGPKGVSFGDRGIVQADSQREASAAGMTQASAPVAILPGVGGLTSFGRAGASVSTPSASRDTAFRAITLPSETSAGGAASSRFPATLMEFNDSGNPKNSGIGDLFDDWFGGFDQSGTSTTPRARLEEIESPQPRRGGHEAPNYTEWRGVPQQTGGNRYAQMPAGHQAFRGRRGASGTAKFFFVFLIILLVCILVWAVAVTVVFATTPAPVIPSRPPIPVCPDCPTCEEISGIYRTVPSIFHGLEEYNNFSTIDFSSGTTVLNHTTRDFSGTMQECRNEVLRDGTVMWADFTVDGRTKVGENSPVDGSTSGTCYLSTAIPTIETLTNINPYNYRMGVRNHNNNTYQIWSRAKFDINDTKFDIGTSTATTIEGCMAACTGSPGCSWFNFDATTSATGNRCQLKGWTGDGTDGVISIWKVPLLENYASLSKPLFRQSGTDPSIILT